MAGPTFAIDSQISLDRPGGTETALLSLLGSIGRIRTPDRFLLIGAKRHGKKLKPMAGPNQEVTIWPWPHSWYVPPPDAEWSREWKMMKSVLGPFGDFLPALYGLYDHNKPLGSRTRVLYRNLGPLRTMVPPLYRIFSGIRNALSGKATAKLSDARLEPYDVSAIHFPSPHHFPTNLPFIYEPWGLPHHHEPEAFSPGERAWMEEVFREGCRRASLVVTATRWVKEDIVERYSISRSKIAVIPRVPWDSFEKVHGEFGEIYPDLPRGFALFPAATWPTKNHRRLLRVLARLRDRHGIRLPVVCTGILEEKQWPKIRSDLDLLGLGNQVRFLGAVPRAHLAWLFRSARFLLFPSLFEGLGLPVLEAFHYGLPIVASNATCIPEVAGDAAIFFDPHDEKSMERTLLEVVRNPSLLDRLPGAGRERLNSSFPDSDKISGMFLACYRKAGAVPLTEKDRAYLREMIEE
jgi:glycosyltransferase involved in cell wall biosynthesis